MFRRKYSNMMKKNLIAVIISVRAFLDEKDIFTD